MNFVLDTGVGFWNPLVFVAGLLLVLLVSYRIWSRGEKGCQRGVQGEAFFSGDPAPRDSVRAKDMYWGFMEEFKIYYERMVNLHTGVINDYVAWVIALMAVLLILVAL